MSDQVRTRIAARDVPPDRRRGAEIRVLLGPRTVGSTSGFLGVAALEPGERVNEHYHPYSEEFLYVTRGAITVDLDDCPVPLAAGEALYVPVNTRHRLRNTGPDRAELVFHLGPLAPRPELGHVDTEGPAVLGPGPGPVPGPGPADTGSPTVAGVAVAADRTEVGT